MRCGVVVLCGALALGGCVDQSFFVKNAVTYDRYERDYVGCSTDAAQKVPTNTQVGWMPYVGIYSADTNTALRTRNFELCMRDHGYSQAKLPFCTGDKAKAAEKRARMPQNRGRVMHISQSSCYVHRPDGTPFLYTPENA